MALTTSLNATMLVPSRVAIVLAKDRLAPRGSGGVAADRHADLGLTLTVIAALALLLTTRSDWR